MLTKSCDGELQYFWQKRCGTWVRISHERAAEHHHNAERIRLMSFAEAVFLNARCSGDDDHVL